MYQFSFFFIGLAKVHVIPQMPNRDGLEATRMIREKGYQGPIVALTAFAEESNVKECFEVGMDMFLGKPVQKNQLKEVLKTYYTPPKPLISKSGYESVGKEDINRPSTTNFM